MKTDRKHRARGSAIVTAMILGFILFVISAGFLSLI